jgi:hypothetical protein
VADINQLELGKELGELTQAVRALTERIGSLESDMKTFQLFFAGGKGAVVAFILFAGLLINGASALMQKLWDLVK